MLFTEITLLYSTIVITVGEMIGCMQNSPQISLHASEFGSVENSRADSYTRETLRVVIYEHRIHKAMLQNGGDDYSIAI